MRVANNLELEIQVQKILYQSITNSTQRYCDVSVKNIHGNHIFARDARADRPEMRFQKSTSHWLIF